MFTEQKILDQLNIQNNSELCRILKSKLRNNNIKIDFESEHNYYKISGSICICSDIVVLKKGSEQNVHLKTPSNKKIIDGRKISLIKDRNFFGKGYDQECHRGHLLAEQFKGYTQFEDFNFSIKNPHNIYPQWVNANLNRAHKSKIYGQAYFENKVIKWLKQNDKVQYRVIPIFKKNIDLYPIGNVIIAVKCIDDIDSTKKCITYEFDDIQINNFFVFIPNYLDTDVVDKIVNKRVIK